MDLPTIGDALPTRGNRFSQWLAQSLMSLFGWHIDAELPNQSKLVLVGAPHTSNWDFILTVGTLYALNVKIFWMGKKSLFNWPIGGIMKWLGGVPVDRASNRGGLVDQTIEAFNTRDKFVIAIMPEATRSKVREWKTGFYHIAEGAKVPIVLIRFDYGRKIMGIGPTIQPTGDITADLAEIQSHYADIKGKKPSQFSG